MKIDVCRSSVQEHLLYRGPFRVALAVRRGAGRLAVAGTPESKRAYEFAIGDFVA
jgi:hypothetical protein